MRRSDCVPAPVDKTAKNEYTESEAGRVPATLRIPVSHPAGDWLLFFCIRRKGK